MIDISAAIIFIIFLTAFILIRRKKITVQKILYPVFYLMLYKSDFGIRFMNKIADKYREVVKFFGYVCIGISFVGMIFVSINILLILFNIFAAPTAETGVALILPFTNVPGFGHLSFLHWIISIFVLAVVHEFAHGIVSIANGLKVKSSGFAFLAILVPLLPAAFVEPDEKKLMKKDDVTQYSIFAAGPVANILLALILLFALPYITNPVEERITEPVGFTFDLTNQTMPAAKAGLQSGMVITSFNNQTITDANEAVAILHYCVKPGQTVFLGTENATYTVTKVEDETGRGMIGITNVRNEKRVKPEYKWLEKPFYWVKDLLKWLISLNFLVGIFNLLPLGIVDGGRIMNTFLQRSIKDKEKAKKIFGFISLFFLAIILLGLIKNYIGNPFSILIK